MTKSVAIIIVNWNGYEVTRQCLLSLKRVSYSNYKVILVDNASADQRCHHLDKEFQEIVFIQNTQNLGFTGGNNEGMKQALGMGVDYICLLNNDTEVEPNFLIELLNAIESSDKIGAVQPKILYNQKRDVVWNAGGHFQPWLANAKTIGVNEKDLGQYDQARKVDWISGCCILLHTNTIKNIGLLNDQFFAYFEDVDWSFRIRRHGLSLYYVPQSVVFHEAGFSLKQQAVKEGTVSPFAHYLNIRNQIFILRLYSKGFFLPTSWAFQSLKVISYVVYFIFRGRFEKMKSALHGLKHGLTTPLLTKKIE